MIGGIEASTTLTFSTDPWQADRSRSHLDLRVSLRYLIMAVVSWCCDPHTLA